MPESQEKSLELEDKIRKFNERIDELVRQRNELLNEDSNSITFVDSLRTDSFMFSFRYNEKNEVTEDLLKEFTAELKTKFIDEHGKSCDFHIHSLQKLKYNKEKAQKDEKQILYSSVIMVEVQGYKSEVMIVKKKIQDRINQKDVENNVEGFVILQSEASLIPEKNFQPLQVAARNMSRMNGVAKGRNDIDIVTDKVNTIEKEVQKYKKSLEDRKKDAIKNVEDKFLKSFENKHEGNVHDNFGWKKVEEQQNLSDATIKMLVEDMKEFKKNEEKRKGTIDQCLQDREEWGKKIEQLEAKLATQKAINGPWPKPMPGKGKWNPGVRVVVSEQVTGPFGSEKLVYDVNGVLLTSPKAIHTFKQGEKMGITYDGKGFVETITPDGQASVKSISKGDRLVKLGIQAKKDFKGKMGIECGEDGIVQKVIDNKQAQGINVGDKIVNVSAEDFSLERLQVLEDSGTDYNVTVVQAENFSEDAVERAEKSKADYEASFEPFEASIKASIQEGYRIVKVENQPFSRAALDRAREKKGRGYQITFEVRQLMGTFVKDAEDGKNVEVFIDSENVVAEKTQVFPKQQVQLMTDFLEMKVNQVENKLMKELFVAQQDVLKPYKFPELQPLQSCFMRLCCFPLPHMDVLSAHQEPLRDIGCWADSALLCCCCFFETDHVNKHRKCFEDYKDSRFVRTVVPPGRKMEAEHTCTFTASEAIGVVANFKTGVVTQVVKDGQADKEGVKVGMRFSKVGLEPYSEEILDRAVGKATYTFNGKMGIKCDEDGNVQKVIDSEQAKGIKAGDKIVNVSAKSFSLDRLQGLENSESDYNVTVQTPGNYPPYRVTFKIEAYFWPEWDSSQDAKEDKSPKDYLDILEKQQKKTNQPYVGIVDELHTMAEARFKCTFTPGTFGARLDLLNGIVTSVIEGGQAANNNVRAGMRLVKINDAKYSENELLAAIQGKQVYQITFAIEEIAEGDAVEFCGPKAVAENLKIELNIPDEGSQVSSIQGTAAKCRNGTIEFEVNSVKTLVSKHHLRKAESAKPSQDDMRKEATKPPEEPPEGFTLSFKADKPIGVDNKKNGVVTSVTPGGQAEKKGVEVGMQIIKVGNANYTETALRYVTRDAAEREVEYTVTFAGKAPAP